MLEQIGGRIKEAFGRWMGHERMHAQGRAEELRGREQIGRGKAAERTEGAVQEVGGTAKRSVGEAIGSERMAVEGRAKELEGQERREINR